MRVLNTGSKPSVNPEMVEMIVSMGFSKQQAEGSMIKCNNYFDRALDYLMNNPTESFQDVLEPKQAAPANVDLNKGNSSIYDLYGNKCIDSRFYYSSWKEYLSWPLCFSS